jgi:hypothetical protein
MTHYICTGGCGGVAEHEGVCRAETCPLHAHPLVPCDCTDGKHYRLQYTHEAEGYKKKEIPGDMVVEA